ncbi:MAG: PDZ domain-containing protein, partial [Candidatus Eisenbacteria bacterium]|nr:PDZ domain-containing protein [Candidatus Latescibacterota bacterium]MBD3302055.1 PDZ domain-containing protein [Candidatus Eisenbacteria bacterium]
GDGVRLLVFREESEREILVELARRDDPSRRDARDHRSAIRLGVRAAEVDADLAPYFETEAGRGLLVLSVEDGGAADRAGIRSGDLLLRLQEVPLSRIETLRAMLRTIDPQSRWRIEASRRGERVLFEGIGEDLRAAGRSAWGRRNRTVPSPAPLRALEREIDRLERRVDRLERELRRLRRR